ncbi:MAG: hypothetical protein K2Q23_04630, partial [Bryobacteraceae bacterium]|nr:hypothetical protein [Bryobacteraceae bacterium]
MVSLYAKQYGPYEWKRDAIGFDLLNVAPWEERVRRSTSDLEFYEIMVQYVAAMRDSHAVYTLPTNFVATLGFRADLYEGRARIDELTGVRDPRVRIGDELVSVDDRTVEEWIAVFDPFQNSANPDSRRRVSTQWITERPQTRYPRAHEVGPTARVVIRGADGELVTLELPWIRSGTPFIENGPVVDPKVAAARKAAAADSTPLFVDEPWMQPIAPFRMIQVPGPEAVRGSGQRAPLFALPAGFQRRLGTAPNDNLFSGVFESGGRRIGYLRIPQMSPVGQTPGLLTGADLERTYALVDQEVAFFQANTDGVILDVMRNPGGLVTYTEELLRRFIPGRFRTIGFEIRPTITWLNQFNNALTFARLFGAPAWQVTQLEGIVRDLNSAYREQRGRTGPIAVGISTGLDIVGTPAAYTKPLIVLVDGFSASGGDFFPAVIQDAGRGLIVGERTSGAGGNVVAASAGFYSEGTTRVTQSLMNRKSDIRTPDLPAAPYVENIGVRP